jgi:hypothetical protein
MRRMLAVCWATLLAVTLLCATAGCASNGPAAAGDPAPTQTGPRILDPDLAFLVSSLQDWKDYGDAVVAVRVVADRDDPATPAGRNGNGGLIGRLADVRITHTFWVRHAAHQPPARFTAPVSGWFVRHGTRTPTVPRGEPRFEPGHRYLVALARFGDGWNYLTGAAVPFDGGVVGHGEWAGRDPAATQPGDTELLGADTARVQRALDAVQLSAAARRYDRLDPVTRAHRIARARR